MNEKEVLVLISAISTLEPTVQQLIVSAYNKIRGNVSGARPFEDVIAETRVLDQAGEAKADAETK